MATSVGWSGIPSLIHERPAAAPPTSPLTYRSSPGCAPARVRTRRRLTLPTAVTSRYNGPPDRVMLPPTSAVRNRVATANRPSSRASRSLTRSVSGRASDRSACRGTAPIAARSLRLTASTLPPTASSGVNARSKCTPSTIVSVVMTDSEPRSGSTTAASSPIPRSTDRGGRGTRVWIRAMSACSPRSATV